MINDIQGIKKTKDYLYLRLNKTIDLIIFTKTENDKLKFEFNFNPEIITKLEAEEIIDYFFITEGDNIF